MTPTPVLCRPTHFFIHKSQRIPTLSRSLAILLIIALMSPTWALATPLTRRASGHKTSEVSRTEQLTGTLAPQLSAVPASSLKKAPSVRGSVGTEFWLAAPAISSDIASTVELNITGDANTDGTV